MRIEDEAAFEALLRSGALAIDGRMHDVSALVRAIVESGCLLDAHFELQSGLHAQYFLRAVDLLAERARCDRIAQAVLEGAPPEWRAPDTRFLAPESAGALLAEGLCRQTGASLAVAKVDLARRPTRELRRDTLGGAGRVVIVNDVCTSGKSIQPLLDLVSEGSVPLGGIAHIGVRDKTVFASMSSLRKPFPNIWLLDTLWPVWRPADCPLCAAASRPTIPAIELN